MANNAKDGGGGGGGGGGQQGAHLVRFGCTAKELKELMETRGVDAVNRLRHKYETVDELCRRLHVVPSEGTLHQHHQHHLHSHLRRHHRADL